MQLCKVYILLVHSKWYYLVASPSRHSIFFFISRQMSLSHIFSVQTWAELSPRADFACRMQWLVSFERRINDENSALARASIGKCVISALGENSWYGWAIVRMLYAVAHWEADILLDAGAHSFLPPRRQPLTESEGLLVGFRVFVDSSHSSCRPQSSERLLVGGSVRLDGYGYMRMARKLFQLPRLSFFRKKQQHSFPAPMVSYTRGAEIKVFCFLPALISSPFRFSFAGLQGLRSTLAASWDSILLSAFPKLA